MSNTSSNPQEKESKAAKKDTRALMARVFGLANEHRALLWTTLFLAVATAPVSVLRPKAVQYMVDEYIVKRQDAEMLLFMLCALVGVIVIEAIFDYVFSYLTSLLGQNVVRNLRVSVFQKLTSLRLSYFDHTTVGKSTTRTISDIESINSTFSQGFITIASDIASLVITLFVMFLTVGWKITLITLSTLPLLIVATYLFKEGVKRSFESVRTQVSNMNSFLQERISGMRVVQIFNAEKQEMETFKEINKKYTKANLDSNFWYSLFFPVVEILSAASLGLMVWYGARGLLDETITVGIMVAFPQYISMMYRPMRVIADKFNQLQMGLIAAERVFEVLDNDELIENKGTLKPSKLKGEVTFENVHFSYAEKSEENSWILDNVNFQLPAGETLAIVGSTGSGKTTIISVLNRLYEIQKGRILIDGVDAKDYELHALRRRIAVVLQDVFLFSGTVFENITLRNPQITMEQVELSAKAIGAHEFIMKLPGGYNYEVMERGAMLSMGQRQLISFVRALVFDPDILVLDEATSSVDPETESVIQYAITKLIEKRTSIIIAHRLSTIQHSDKLLVMQRGQVVESGSPRELLQRENGHYRRLYDMQFEQMALD